MESNEELHVFPIPEKRSFASKEDLMSSLRKVAFDNGYAVSIKTSFKTKTWIVCSRSGEYRNNNTEKRPASIALAQQDQLPLHVDS